MKEKLKKIWFNLTHVKCDYCKQAVEQYYDSWMFPIKEYKGSKICLGCVRKLPNQERIVYIKQN